MYKRQLESSPARRARALEERGDEIFEATPRDPDLLLTRDLGKDDLERRQRVLRLARFVEHEADQLRRLAGLVETKLGEERVSDGAVHVVAPELAVATGRTHLEHAVVEQQGGDVEGCLLYTSRCV